jgi:ATP-binding cassette, subfamily A (ABC1), member 3
MTVLEHMEFYAKIKGLQKDQRQKHIDDVLKQLGLYFIKNKIASRLSGGNQRKVCLA